MLGDRLTVRPPWEPAGETALDVVIDPGQAFGTGAHATTRLCLELLLEPPRTGEASPTSAAGRGCWRSSPPRLGFTPVLAFDYDPLAVAATARERATATGSRCEAQALDLRTDQVPVRDLWVANVLAGPLRAWAASQREVAGELILSGLLREEASDVAQAFATTACVRSTAASAASGPRSGCGADPALRARPGRPPQGPDVDLAAPNLVHAAHVRIGPVGASSSVSLVIPDNRTKGGDSCQTHSQSA